jgi:ferrous iron transport protein B
MDSTPSLAVGTRHLALVGNPNCGKTSIFNALSGLNQHVGNFAGVTVERKSSRLTLANDSRVTLTDLPGINSLYPNSEDEKLSCEVLLNRDHPDHPDQVVLVVDVTQLRRGLMLCTQVLDLGIPTLLVLNMMDRLKQESLEVDPAKLAQWLGIPVIGISALEGKGIRELRKALEQDFGTASQPFMQIPSGFQPAIEYLSKKQGIQPDYRAYMAVVSPEPFPGISSTEIKAARAQIDMNTETGARLVSNELLVRLDRVDGILSESVRSLVESPLSLTEKIDRILVHRVWGYAIFLGILLLIFQSIFAWATHPMDLIEAGIEGLKGMLSAALPAHWLTDLLTEGVITGLGGIVIFVPQIAFLFFFIAVMEESGYMARVVFLMDRIMRPFGFSGKSIIPLMGGMACAIPSIMMTRNIPNRTERLITILVTPLMSCSARIPVYTLLIAMFIPADRIWGFDQRGLLMTGLYLLGFFAALAMAWVFKKILRYDSKALFMLEMPSYHVPRWRNIGLTVWQKSKDFLWEAGKIILLISIILWWLVAYGPGEEQASIEAEYATQLAAPDLSEAQVAELELNKNSALLEASYAAHLGKFIEPAIRPLGYDWKIGISLITSFAAREVFVGTMSIIYQQQDPDSFEAEEAQESGRITLIERLQREIDPRTGKPVYTTATVLSLLIFYAFAMQCMSTLAVTRREVGWLWTGVMLLYLTVLAYVSAWLTYLVFI